MWKPPQPQVINGRENTRIVRAADSAAEVNFLDSVNMPLNDAQIGKFHRNIFLISTVCYQYAFHSSFRSLINSLYLIVQACDDLKDFIAQKEADTGACSPSEILQQVRQLQFQLNVTREYKMFLAMMSIFGSHRNIVQHWDAFEPVFTQLMAQEGGENGRKHFFQTVC